MKISIITLFPSMIEGFLTESIVGKAVKKGMVELEIINLRDFAKDTYGSVDDRPYGGGAGMVLKVDLLHACLQSVLGEERHNSTKCRVQSTKKMQVKVRVILTSAKGHTYSQAKAEKYASKYNHLVIIAGHYEGVDERILQFIDDEVSIGQYVLTGGELPAAIIADSVIRLIPGVLGDDMSNVDESFSQGLLEYPQYTRPEKFKDMEVPGILRGGNHAEITKWRRGQAIKKTQLNRPDLIDF